MQLDLRVGQMLQQLMVEVDMSDFINISCVHVVSMTTTSFGCVQVSMTTTSFGCVQVSMGVILHYRSCF
jgi:hypothetical protein